MPRRRNVDLPTVAVIQRQLLWLILFMILMWFAAIALVQYPVAVLIVLLLRLAIHFGALIQVTRLCYATGTGIVVTILVAFLMLLPLLNLIIMLVVNVQATGQLKRAGLRVGLMGASPDQLVKLREGACNGCGYDLAGLDASICPECGLQKPLAMA